MLHANSLGRAARYFLGTNRACSQETRSTFRKLHERVAGSVKGRVDAFGLHADPDETGYLTIIRVGVMRQCGVSIQPCH